MLFEQAVSGGFTNRHDRGVLESSVEGDGIVPLANRVDAADDSNRILSRDLVFDRRRSGEQTEAG